MDDITFLKWLAQGYVRNYRRLGMSTQHTWTDLTQAEINYFAELGTLLGFHAIREDVQTEPKRKDLIWQDPYTREPVMYLERETEDARVPEATLKKLFSPIEELSSHRDDEITRIGVFGWVTPDRLKEVRTEVKKRAGARPTLTISWCNDEKDAGSFELVLFLSTDATYMEATGTATTDGEGYWYGSLNRAKDGMLWERE